MAAPSGFDIKGPTGEEVLRRIIEEERFDGEINIDLEPPGDLYPWGPGESVMAEHPASLGHGSVIVRAPVDDFARLQYYISSLNPAAGASSWDNFWDTPRRADAIVDGMVEALREGKATGGPAEYYDRLPHPWVEVGKDGTLRSTQEGRHRTFAARKAGLETIPFKIVYNHEREGKGGGGDVVPRARVLSTEGSTEDESIEDIASRVRERLGGAYGVDASFEPHIVPRIGKAVVDFELTFPDYPDGVVGVPTSHFRDMGLTKSGIVVREHDWVTEFSVRLPPLPQGEQSLEDVRLAVHEMVEEADPPFDVEVEVARDKETAWTPHVLYNDPVRKIDLNDTLDFILRLWSLYRQDATRGTVGVIHGPKTTDEIMSDIDDTLENISTDGGNVEREIDLAVESQIGADIDDDILAEQTVDLLREWGAATVDTYEGNDGKLVEFYPPFPGDQPIRSTMTWNDGQLRKATIRYGVLRGKQGRDHPQNDPEEIARVVEAVRGAGDPPGGVQVVANYGDDHYDPRPHLLLGWAPFGAHAYDGEQFKRELVHEGEEGGVDVTPQALVDYIVDVGEAISEEFMDDYVDHRPDDSFAAGPPETGLSPQAQRRIDTLERVLNDAAEEMGVGPIEQNSYRTEFSRGVVTLAVRTAVTMDSNPSDFVIDAKTGNINRALVRFEDLPIEPQVLYSSEWQDIDGRLSETIESVEPPSGVEILETMAAGHVGKTPHLDFEQDGDLPPKALADYLVEVDEAIKEEFAPEREGQEGYDLSDPEGQRKAIMEAMDQSYAHEIHEAVKRVFGVSGYEEVTRPGPQGPDDRRVHWTSLIDSLQSESDSGRGTAKWIIEEIEARTDDEDFEHPKIANVPKGDGGNHTAIVTRDNYEIRLGTDTLENIRPVEGEFDDVPFQAWTHLRASRGISVPYSYFRLDVEIMDDDDELLGNMGCLAIGLPGDQDDIEGSKLSHLWVDPDHRGEGVGSTMLDFYFAFAAWCGGRAVLTFGEEDGESRAFLESMGIAPEEIKEGGGGWAATSSVAATIDIEDFVAEHDWIDVTVTPPDGGGSPHTGGGDQDFRDDLGIELSDQFDGLSVFAVGGAVRALFTGNPTSDIDLMVTGVDPDSGEMESRGFDLVQTAEQTFPVYIDDEGREVALARTERSTGPGYQDFEVVPGAGVTVEEDLGRRDFTVNAMAVSLAGSGRFAPGELIDPFDGRGDIERGVIRAVKPNTFAEDPLRVLRMARFAARLGFDVDPGTLESAREHAGGLTDLPRERWGLEVTKAMKQAPAPSRFFRLLVDIGALDIVLPELAALRGVPAGPGHAHGEGDAFEHTMLVLDEMATLRPGEPRAMFAALAHDFGKALTPRSEWPSHYRHHIEGADLMDGVQARLALSSELRGVMATASRYHMRMRNLFDLRDSTLIEMVDRLRDDYAGDDPTVKHITLDELVDLAVADARGREPPADFDAEAARELFDDVAEVIDDIGGEHVAENFDPDSGEHFGQLLMQERIRALRDRRGG